MRNPAGIMIALLVGSTAVVCAADSKEVPVARVGERVITRALLEDAVTVALNANYYHGRLTADRQFELEKEQIQQLIRRELNLLGALDRGLGLPKEAAETLRISIEKRLGSESYEATLAAAGVTRKGHELAIAETMLAQQAYEKFVLFPAAVDDEMVRAAFDASPDHWRMPDRAHLLHILLKVPPGANMNAIDGVRKRANAIKERLDSGESFGDLAAEYSQDPYRIKGGDLGWIYRGNLVAPLEEAVWQAGVGTVVGPLLADDGFHLAKVLERQAARLMEFVEVEPMLREQIEKKSLEDAESSWFGPLRKKYPVVILDSNLSKGLDER